MPALGPRTLLLPQHLPLAALGQVWFGPHSTYPTPGGDYLYLPALCCFPACLWWWRRDPDLGRTQFLPYSMWTTPCCSQLLCHPWCWVFVWDTPPHPGLGQVERQAELRPTPTPPFVPAMPTPLVVRSDYNPTCPSWTTCHPAIVEHLGVTTPTPTLPQVNRVDIDSLGGRTWDGWAAPCLWPACLPHPSHNTPAFLPTHSCCSHTPSNPCLGCGVETLFPSPTTFTPAGHWLLHC